jgi:predicted amidohydrolase
LGALPESENRQASMKVACIQMCSGINPDENLKNVERWLAEAAGQGVELAVLPESFTLMGATETEKVASAEPQESSTLLAFLAKQAARHKMAIIGGSILLQADNGKVRNVCAAYDADGSLLAIYDKIHLFDADVGEDAYRESAIVQAGKTPSDFQLSDFIIGLSICYDLRFPELYRHYSKHGCNVLCVVAAFTDITGRAHWQSLLKARAIENQAYVLASAQWGEHPDGRKTWGHSMIIDPWGKILAELPAGDGIISVELGIENIRSVRHLLPVLDHRML